MVFWEVFWEVLWVSLGLIGVSSVVGSRFETDMVLILSSISTIDILSDIKITDAFFRGIFGFMVICILIQK